MDTSVESNTTEESDTITHNEINTCSEETEDGLTTTVPRKKIGTKKSTPRKAGNKPASSQG